MNRAIWIVVGLLFVGLLVFFLIRPGESQYQWWEGYEQEGMQPYDVDLLYNLLDDLEGRDLRVDMEQRIPQALPLEGDLPTKRPSYVFVGNRPYFSTSEADSLLLFVERGGTAFIASNSIPKEFMNYLYFDGCRDEDGGLAYWQNYHVAMDSSVTLNLVHPALKTAEDYSITYRGSEGVQAARWSFIPDIYLCEGNVHSWASLGTFYFVSSGQGDTGNLSYERHTIADFGVEPGQAYINFVRIQYKKGYVYLYTQPRVFSNYFLRNKEVFEYANKVFSHLPEGKVYWDKVSTQPKRADNSPSRRPRDVSDSPLQYIFTQPSLRWAWYTLIAGALLFVLFRAKRRQRIIPVVEENRNTSLAFVKTVGSLYFQRNNHKHLLEQQMQLFLNRMRQRYGLPTRALDEELRSRLSQRSEVNRETVDEIFDLYNNVKQAEEVRDATLIRFYNLLEHFYQQAK